MAEVVNEQQGAVDIPEKIVLRSWPKMLFFWPSALVALAAGLGTYLNPELNDRWEFWGTLFLVVFALNLMIITFEFPRSTSLTLALVCVAIAWIFIEVNRRYNIVAPLKDFLEELQLVAMPDFYFTIFIIYMLLLIGMFISTRFSYWEISNNEMIHHQGLMQDVERFDTDGLHYNKEITDFFEYIIGRSGRIIIISPSVEKPIVLDNVVRINSVAAVLDQILEYKRVIVSNSPNQPFVGSPSVGSPPVAVAVDRT